MTSLKFQEPDRVPVAEFLIDKRVYTALMPEAQEQYDFDVKFGLDVLATKAWYRTVSEQGETFTDEWGITYARNKEAVAHPVKAAFEDMADLEKFTVPDPDLPERLSILPKLVKNHKKERAVAFALRAMFLWAANLTGLDNLLVYMLIEPAFVHDLLDKIVEAQTRLARNALAAGADIVIDTDDYAFNNGPLMSPELFDLFITPRLKKFAATVHKEGGYFLKHTDGNLMKIMDSFIEAGIDGIQSIDPIAGMDMGEMKARYGKKISLWGNIECGNLLANGTRDDVRMAVRECIEKGARGGGFVLMSSNSIPYSAKPGNFLALLDAAKEFGHYPLQI
jgi:uroporphyrinogen decarboxylase